MSAQNIEWEELAMVTFWKDQGEKNILKPYEHQ